MEGASRYGGSLAPHYLPWVGERYSAEGFDGLKLLLLGLSHSGDRSRTATWHWLGRHVVEGGFPFWLHIEKVVAGAELGAYSRKDFWNRVAFANLLQESLDEPHEPGPNKFWTPAKRAIQTLIPQLRPDVLFVFSRTACLPDDGEYLGSRDLVDTRSPYEGDRAYLYAMPGYSLVAGCFDDSSNPVLEAAVWHDWAKTLMEEARRTHIV
jgi:hypothetical protein